MPGALVAAAATADKNTTVSDAAKNLAEALNLKAYLRKCPPGRNSFVYFPRRHKASAATRNRAPNALGGGPPARTELIFHLAAWTAMVTVTTLCLTSLVRELDYTLADP